MPAIIYLALFYSLEKVIYIRFKATTHIQSNENERPKIFWKTQYNSKQQRPGIKGKNTCLDDSKNKAQLTKLT